MEKKLEYYAGDGYGGVPETGTFEVKVKSGDINFHKLSKAREHYDSLNEEKAIWDITGSKQELLEAHCFIEHDDNDEIPF